MAKKTEKTETEVEELITKAVNAYDSGDALRWSQAACNAANALCAQASLKLG